MTFISEKNTLDIPIKAREVIVREALNSICNDTTRYSQVEQVS